MGEAAQCPCLAAGSSDQKRLFISGPVCLGAVCSVRTRMFYVRPPRLGLSVVPFSLVQCFSSSSVQKNVLGVLLKGRYRLNIHERA